MYGTLTYLRYRTEPEQRHTLETFAHSRCQDMRESAGPISYFEVIL